MSTPLGIPDDYFERRPERFFERIGRVVAAAALLEQHVLYLAWVLDRDKAQDVHAGKHGVALLEVCGKKLGLLPDELAAVGRDLLAEVGTALEKRNVIVHNVWPTPGMDQAYGHRPLPKSKRMPGEIWIADGVITSADMDELIERLGVLLEDIMRFRDKAESAHTHGQRAATLGLTYGRGTL